MNYTYCLSKWIANLGVVPLLLLRFFLFKPIFFNLKRLLVLVICVLDDITIPFEAFLTLSNEGRRITFTPLVVKTLSLILLFHTGAALGQSTKDIFLTTGEQKILNFQTFTKFSIGNREVISASHNTTSNELIIKAKKPGYSDILVWTKEKSNLQINVYVQTRSNKKSITVILKTFPNLKKNSYTKTISGHINTLNEYLKFKELLKNINLADFQIQVGMSERLKNLIHAKVYEEIYSYHQTISSCSTHQLNTVCHYYSKMDDTLLKSLEQKYKIRLKFAQSKVNFELQFHIVQVSKSLVKRTKLGIDSIKVELEKVLNFSKLELSDYLELKKDEINGRIIASPLILTQLNQESNIKLGSEIPFQLQRDQANSPPILQWRFAGLKVKVTLEKIKNEYLINYNATLSKPSENNMISGSQTNSRIRLEENKFIKAFEVSYTSNSLSKSSVPIWEKIPILKYLFSSFTKSNGLIHLIGFIKVVKK